jgi:Predicted nucleic acid-binding protein, contains PIN domain
LNKKIILDTNIFSNKEFCGRLKDSNHTAYISAISYTELLYHYLKKEGRSGEGFIDAFFEALNIQVIPFDRECAKIASKSAIDRWDFKDNARDYMIGSLAVKLGYPIITFDTKDFEWIEEGLLFGSVLTNSW